MDAERLVHAADLALYHVKRSGRAGVERFREEIEAAFGHKQVLQRRVGDGAREERIRAGVPAAGRRDDGPGRLRRGAAALDQRQLGRDVPPDEFLPIAASAGMMPEIDAWVLETALRQLAAWTDWAAAPKLVAINISATTLTDPDFAARVADALARHEVSADRLEIEVPENVATQDLRAVALTLQQLCDLGVRLGLGRSRQRRVELRACRPTAGPSAEVGPIDHRRACERGQGTGDAARNPGVRARAGPQRGRGRCRAGIATRRAESRRVATSCRAS
ncbi:MAG: EAL domain-containing protein [Acetobacteraceae bacterium]